MKKTLLVFVALAGVAAGQIDFELQSPSCTYAFPSACGAAGDAELVSWNGVTPTGTPVFGLTVATSNGLGMPCVNLQFLRLQCAAVPTGIVPAGGPIPSALGAAEAYIPIPPGATFVTFCWDFYSAEGQAAAGFNDAVNVDTIALCGGPTLGSLLFVDTNTPSHTVVDPPPCGVVFYSPAGSTYEVSPPGPQYFVGVLPASSAFLRVQAANSSDNSFPSQFVLDDVVFGFGPPPPIPCTLQFTSPFGPGSIKIDNTPCNPAIGANYFIALDLTGGAYPNGWWFGLDIGINELIGLFNFGPPLASVLDLTGASSTPTFTGPLSGITFYGVTTHWGPGFGAFIGSRPAISYTVP